MKSWILALLCLCAPACAPEKVIDSMTTPPDSPQETTQNKESKIPTGANRLIHEESPYLQQHAHNPVDWYPWSDEAFEKAKREDKPLLVSIGYSTCYWCHVMEKESFENADVAKVINETVVAIKVDREERPDVDSVYMEAVQAMTGSGGWPLNVFITPDGKPFYGGTYFPPEDRYGRPGFVSVLKHIDQTWKENRENISAAGEKLTAYLDERAQSSVGKALNAEDLQQAARTIAEGYDEEHGGFGRAPKFPRSHTLSFLIRAARRFNEPKYLEMVEHTLTEMARGGLFDHLGGGFHRYSTDREWLVPHFEKMLYDQALLARTFVEAYQVTQNPYYALIARRTLDYVLTDLRDPRFPFWSAEDAGEVGLEGVFYVWEVDEAQEILGEDYALAARYFDITPQGNFEHRNILHEGVDAKIVAQEFDLSEDQLNERIDSVRAKLLAVRSERERPHLDDKILTDWNGLMIGTMAYAGRVLQEPKYTQAGAEAAVFIAQRLTHEKGLWHRYREGAAIEGFLEDYAFLAHGYLELFETTYDAVWLEKTQKLTAQMLDYFWDAEQGGFYSSGERNEVLISRSKSLYDGASPSGNSVALWNLLRLATLTNDDGLKERIEKLMAVFAEQVRAHPEAYPMFLLAADMYVGPRWEIVIAGERGEANAQAMQDLVQQTYVPHAVTAFHPTGDLGVRIQSVIPFIKNQTALNGRATAYVCKEYSCLKPALSVTELQDQLKNL